MVMDPGSTRDQHPAFAQAEQSEHRFDALELPFSLGESPQHLFDNQPMQSLEADYSRHTYHAFPYEFQGFSLMGSNYSATPTSFMPRSCPDLKIEDTMYTVPEGHLTSVYDLNSQSQFASSTTDACLPQDYSTSSYAPLDNDFSPSTRALTPFSTSDCSSFRHEHTPFGDSNHAGSPQSCHVVIKEDTPEDDLHDREQPYAKLIYRALMEAPDHGMVLKDIYKWFEEHTDKATASESTKGWQNSIRHNLSMNGAFQKVDLPTDGNGDSTKKSFLWRLTEEAKRDGVKSTTRYRSKQPNKRSHRQAPPAPLRQASGSKGGRAAKRIAAQRRSERVRSACTQRYDHLPPVPNDRMASSYFVDGQQPPEQGSFQAPQPGEMLPFPGAYESDFSSGYGTPAAQSDDSLLLGYPSSLQLFYDGYDSSDDPPVPPAPEVLHNLIQRHEADSMCFPEYEFTTNNYLGN